MKAEAQTLGVARSNLIERLQGRSRPRQGYHKAEDAELVPLIMALVAARPTYGYRRITAILNRQRRSEGAMSANHKRVYRIMRTHNLLLARKYLERPEHVHDGKVIVMRSNLRWCSDGFEFTCWNGDVIRGAFLIDAHDREIISWRAVVNAGISGSDIHDLLARGRRAAVLGPARAIGNRGSHRQRLALHRQGHADLRAAARPEALLHAGAKPAEQRHVRGVREDPEARLRPGDAAAGRSGSPWIARHLDRGLQ